MDMITRLRSVLLSTTLLLNLFRLGSTSVFYAQVNTKIGLLSTRSVTHDPNVHI